MPTASYFITEPHPTVPQHAYTHSGRGGAGNTFRVDVPTTSPAGVPTSAAPPSPSFSAAPGPAGALLARSVSAASAAAPARFYSGRGGAGNANYFYPGAGAEQGPAAVARRTPAIDFEDEFARVEVREAAATVGRVGRGGAGNIFPIAAPPLQLLQQQGKPPARRKSSAGSVTSSSTTDADSVAKAGFWRRLGGGLGGGR